MDAGDFSDKTRTYICDYIKFADTKAAAVVAVIGVVGGTFGLSIDRFLALIHSAHCVIVISAYLLGAIVVVSAVLTIWYAIEALSPRTDSAGASLASFPDISEMSVAEYTDRTSALLPESITKEYAIANVSLSRIAKTKFLFVSKTIWWLRFVLFGFFGIALLYLLQMIISKA